MTIRVLHAADLHLDAPLSGAGDAPRFAEATLQAFRRLIDVALEQKVDAVLLAGDLYEKRDQSVRARLHCVTQLKRLHDAGIPSFIVRGNHDPLSADPGGLALPASCTVFGSQVSEVPVIRDGAVRFRVQGVSFAETSETNNLSRQFSRQGAEPTIGLLHCNVTGTTGHANYAPCSVDDLSAAGFDYWALGHVHTRQQFELSNGGVAAYPGNLQGRHAKETGARGALLVEFAENRRGVSKVQFIECDVVRWHRVEIDLADVDTLDGLVDEAVAAAQSLLSQAPRLGHAVRVVLKGRGALHAQVNEAHECEGLRLTIAERLKSFGISVEQVVDESGPDVDVQAARAGGGVPALLAAWLDAAPAEVEKLWGNATELKALENRLERLGGSTLSDDRVSLVQQAAALAIAELRERR